MSSRLAAPSVPATHLQPRLRAHWLMPVNAAASIAQDIVNSAFARDISEPLSHSSDKCSSRSKSVHPQSSMETVCLLLEEVVMAYIDVPNTMTAK